ncbi:DUF4829 domain-containing protein [Natranaerobius thermophilus]|uniref:DUF4829 domain-containing protein n=1 Tax=Natranaerobius thermophilus (strain ATCC BAA-1301 / DSM 18059 / JW/NM-WN-LF) TaxID=457570 RepID=B2A132_NATTJ|nr:DUF4829 domain-containing protein [Natranaerobius thermophilus]ACB84655.1 hypothetical protein Nther_1071 [Natranaerobius thermophilus JW/NM-WN-LF]
MKYQWKEFTKVYYILFLVVSTLLIIILPGCLEGSHNDNSKPSEKEEKVDKIIKTIENQGAREAKNQFFQIAEKDQEKAMSIMDKVEETLEIDFEKLYEKERQNRINENITEKIEFEDKELLSDYGWTVSEAINSFNLRLPESFEHKPGEFPEVIYWAYNNELNKDIGKDLRPYLGNEVTVNLYDIEEDLPEFMSPREDSGRAIVVRDQNEIIGAWLGAGSHDDFACSLRGKQREEITGETWEEWVDSIIDADNPKERELNKLGAQEIIEKYWEAADKGEYSKAYSLLSRCNLRSYLFSNMDNRELYNQSFNQGVIGGLYNIESVELLEVEKQEHYETNHDSRDKKQFKVTVDKTVKDKITHGSGKQPRFMTLVRETPETGWRISGIGTGP